MNIFYTIGILILVGVGVYLVVMAILMPVFVRRILTVCEKINKTLEKIEKGEA